jgi:hypothetical protein
MELHVGDQKAVLENADFAPKTRIASLPLREVRSGMVQRGAGSESILRDRQALASLLTGDTEKRGVEAVAAVGSTASGPFLCFAEPLPST